MYIKENRLYDNGVSFEIPQGARVNINPSGSVAIFKNDEPWYIDVGVWNGPFSEKQLVQYIADLHENNNIGALRTIQKTVNGVFMRQVSYDLEDYPNEPACTYFLNEHLEIEDFWMHCQVWCSVYDPNPSSGKKIEDHPVINAFISSVRKEPFEEWQEIPRCVTEFRKNQKNISDGVVLIGKCDISDEEKAAYSIESQKMRLAEVLQAVVDDRASGTLGYPMDEVFNALDEIVGE